MRISRGQPPVSAARRWLLAAALPLAAVVPAGGATFTAAEMMKLQRLSDPQVSPDGRHVLYTAMDVDLAGDGRNNDLWVVPLAGGEARRLTSHAKSDTRGRWSPDGRRIAFVSARAGAPQVFVMDAAGGEPRQATSLPTGAGGVLWADAATLLVTSDVFPECEAANGAYDADCNRKRLGTAAPSSARVYDHLLYRHWDTWEDGRRTHLLVVPGEGGTVRDLTPGARDVPPFGLGGPDDYAVSPDGREVAFVRKDDPVEAISTNGELFDPARKYPLLVLIHGGPQGVWPDGWSFRWNAQVFASAGYVVFMPNPRGSIGWGQEFVDDVSADWGGRAYEDVLRGTDFAEALPYVERGRTAAAGASFGGYMVNWIAGHTDRYRALVSHDGVFDLTSMYGATEELWFVEWEFRGPFWEHPEAYARWSPSAHVRNFKTPTLVIHGEQDHRVPLEQGLAMFTALQRRGVPARLVVFPDEGHWVLKPANSVRWYQEVLGWLERWMGPTS